MTKKLRPLLRRTKLLPGESLQSLLVRLTSLNHYQSETISNTIADALGRPKINLNHPGDFEIFQALSTLSKIDVEHLHAASFHRLADTVIHPDYIFGSIQFPSGVIKSLTNRYILRYHARSDKNLAFCPNCLAKAPYHRLQWMLLGSPVCLEHKCLLIDRCPNCHENLDIADVTSTKCSLCGFNLNKAVTISLVGDEFGLSAHTIIQSWFIDGWTDPALLAQHSIPEQPVDVLYNVLEGLSKAIRKIRKNWDYLHKSTFSVDYLFPYPESLSEQTADKAYLLSTTAFRGLTDWPIGFHGFLDAYKMR